MTGSASLFTGSPFHSFTILGTCNYLIPDSMGLIFQGSSPAPRSPSIIISPSGDGADTSRPSSRADARTPYSTPGLRERGAAAKAVTPEQDTPTPTTSPRRSRTRTRSRSRTPPPPRYRHHDAERRRTPPRSSPGRAHPAAVSGAPMPARSMIDMSIPPPGLPVLHPTTMPIAGKVQLVP